MGLTTGYNLIVDRKAMLRGRGVRCLALCATGALARSLSTGASGATLLSTLRVRPYGVLGSRITASGRIEQAAPFPDADTVIVDPAGLDFIQSSPRGAGGAAGSIYSWLGIRDTPRFPVEVSSAIKKPTDAKFYTYDQVKMVVHAVGPDFRVGSHSRDDAIYLLATTYTNILTEFLSSGKPGLRMLPVSGGIFSGKFGPELPAITREALLAVDDAVAREVTARGETVSVDMCIFAENEYSAFETALSPEPWRDEL